MIQVRCDICLIVEVPLNESLKVDGLRYCPDCLDHTFASIDEFDGHEVEQEIDPTTCALCDNDNGQDPHPSIDEVPLCQECLKNAHDKQIPAWVKGMLVGILVLVVCAVIYNYRFYQAYSEFAEYDESISKGETESAIAALEKAYTLVPESSKLAILLSDAYSLRQAKSEIPTRSTESSANSSAPVAKGESAEYIIRADSAIVAGDYESFLGQSKLELRQDPRNPQRIIILASAYACMQASTRKIAYADSSRVYMRRALALAPGDQSLRSFANQIEFRLYSNRILTSPAFRKKFPNGWKVIP